MVLRWGEDPEGAGMAERGPYGGHSQGEVVRASCAEAEDHTADNALASGHGKEAS